MTITGDQVVKMVEIMVAGATICILAFGAYEHGYSLEGNKNGVMLKAQGEFIKQ